MASRLTEHTVPRAIAALRQGLGIATLPCFIRDFDPLLVRVSGTDLHTYGTFWLLTEGETRKIAREALSGVLIRHDLRP